MTIDRTERRLLALATVVVCGLHLPFLPASLDDIDAVNFDLGVHSFNPVLHQPHPPGYPVFIALAKLLHPLGSSHAAGLALMSVLFGSLAVIPLYLLARQFLSRHGAALATLLTVASPLVWFNGVRPMSDTTGFFFEMASLSCLVAGCTSMRREERSGRAVWLTGVVLAALAVGVRLQAVVLVGPALVVGVIALKGARWATAICLAIGLGVWIVPLLILSGGPSAYVASLLLLFRDAMPAESLVTSPGVRRAAVGLWDTLGSPWGPRALAVPVLLLAAAGGVRLLLSNRRALGWALLLFAPYATYHFLLQNTPTIRYAIPVVPLVAILAAGALTTRTKLTQRVTAAVAVLVAVVSVGWTWPAMQAYHRTTSPAAQAIARIAHETSAAHVVVTGHYVFSRYLSRLPGDDTVIRPSPGDVWRSLTEYWKSGGREPVLFLRDPMRETLLRMPRDAQTVLGRWEWPAAVLPLLKGERPLHVELLRIDPPRWFSESGFLITPEAGDPNQVARRPHRAYVLPSPNRRVLIASGSPLGAVQEPITLRVGTAEAERWPAGSSGFFSVTTTLEPVAATSYLPLIFETSAPVLFTDLWVGRADQPAIRPGRGFFMPERDADTNLFRWIAPHAQALVYAPSGGAWLTLRGRLPARTFTAPTTISLAWNGAPFAQLQVPGGDFEIHRPLPDVATDTPWATLTIESSQQFVPDRRLHNGDRRTLSAEILEMAIERRPPE